jgi:hypothetical protein
MSMKRRMVAIPEAKWQEIRRILAVLPSIATTPSGFVLKAVQNEIERVWKDFRLTPEGSPHPGGGGASAPRGPAGTG